MSKFFTRIVNTVVYIFVIIHDFLSFSILLFFAKKGRSVMYITMLSGYTNMLHIFGISLLFIWNLQHDIMIFCTNHTYLSTLIP